MDEARKAAYGYLALSLDKLRDYNSRMTRWHVNREVMAGTFDRHDFSFKWSYAEMAPLITGLGYDWAIKQTAKCIGELVALVRPDAPVGHRDLFDGTDRTGHTVDTRHTEHPDHIGHATRGSRTGPIDHDNGEAPRRSARTSGLSMATWATRQTAPTKQDLPPPPITITCKPGDSLDHLGDASIDVVVMDPPYYDNVMYAELSDFFYVWLKRTAGHVFPELFRRQLTDKENEAVANPAKFRGEKGARALAGQDYRERMAAIFAECRRVLKPDGIMTLMFTHKATGAWDALTKGLIESGFAITASWPINTEAEGSLHIKDKAAANSTIFLVCRPRAAGRPGSAGPDDPGEAGQEGADRLPEQIAPVRAPPDRIDRSEAAGRMPIAPRSGLPRPAPRSTVSIEADPSKTRTPPARLQVREAPGIYEPTRQDAPDLYWEDVEPRVARAVRARVGEFQDAGIAGVDLYLASFGRRSKSSPATGRSSAARRASRRRSAVAGGNRCCSMRKNGTPTQPPRRTPSTPPVAR